MDKISMGPLIGLDSPSSILRRSQLSNPVRYSRKPRLVRVVCSALEWNSYGAAPTCILLGIPYLWSNKPVRKRYWRNSFLLYSSGFWRDSLYWEWCGCFRFTDYLFWIKKTSKSDACNMDCVDVTITDFCDKLVHMLRNLLALIIPVGFLGLVNKSQT